MTPTPWRAVLAPDLAPTPAVWTRLEGLFEAFAAADRASPVASVLRTARDTLAADAEYLDPGTSREPVEVVGPAEFTPDWCRALTARALGSGGGSVRERLRTDLPRIAGSGPSAASVAMVCLSRTRQIWLVAVSGSPARTFEPGDLRLLSFVRRMYADHLTHERAQGELKGALLGLIHCLSSAIDAKDSYTAGHSERVARMAVRLAEQMRLPAAVRSDLYLAGLLHDIGKIGVSDAVLRKPGPLTDSEFAEIKRHPVVGERIVTQVRQLKHLCPGVRWHHERVDGRGYPDGLAGDAVPLLARVLAVADATDAMTSARPYRAAIPPARVAATLRAGAGSQWDAAVVEAFAGCADDLYAICSRGWASRCRPPCRTARAWG